MTNTPAVSSLHIYPIKSCKGIDLETAFAGPRGLEVGEIRDRSWMLVGENNVMISQREEPKLAKVAVQLVGATAGKPESLLVSAEGMETIGLRAVDVGDDKQIFTVHGKPVSGHIAPQHIGEWFSGFLGRQVRAVYQKEEDLRLCDPDFTADPQSDKVGFADGFPYLVTTQATLDALNGQLETPIPMSRFRPNIVVSGTLPDDEYGWRAIAVGDAEFSLVKPCTRCVMTTIDQNTGARMGNEHMRVLGSTHALKQRIGNGSVQGLVFGENGVPTASGAVNVGDRVFIRNTKPVYDFRRAPQANA